VPKLAGRRRSRNGQRLLVKYDGYRRLLAFPGKECWLWRTLGLEARLGVICSFRFRLSNFQLRFLCCS
jgi:hypothetical protein